MDRFTKQCLFVSGLIAFGISSASSYAAIHESQQKVPNELMLGLFASIAAITGSVGIVAESVTVYFSCSKQSNPAVYASQQPLTDLEIADIAHLASEGFTNTEYLSLP